MSRKRRIRQWVPPGEARDADRSPAFANAGHEGLPAFIAWLSRIVALPIDSPARYGTLYFNAEYDAAGVLRVWASPTAAARRG